MCVEYLIPYNYSLFVGQVEWNFGESWNQNLFRGIATDVNMFSSALTMERMVDMTNGQSRGLKSLSRMYFLLSF